MHNERMKAAEKLLPVRVTVAVEMDEPGERNEDRAENKSGYPRDGSSVAFGQERIGESSRSMRLFDEALVLDCVYPQGLNPGFSF
jgi:hypothetical protein